MLKYMLDTNIVIYVLKRRPEELLSTFNAHAGHMCISSITLAELIHGVEKSSFPERNRRNVEDFVSRPLSETFAVASELAQGTATDMLNRT